jgi:hypothetical protein
MNYANFLLPSIKRLLGPTWRYYCLAKGQLCLSIPTSIEFRRDDNFLPFIEEMKLNLILGYEKEYGCPIEIYSQEEGQLGEDYMRMLTTIVLRFRSNFE